MIEALGGFFINSDKGAHRRDHFIRRAQVGTVAGRIEHDQLAAGYGMMHELTDLGGGDDVFTALQDQRRDLHFGYGPL